MGGTAQKKQNFNNSTFFFFIQIKSFLRHFALFTTIQVAFVYKFFMHKGIAGHITG